MPKLRDTVAYLVAHYPHKNELSKARLTKMVYLTDWKSSIERGHQLTDISWRFNQFGPYVDDIVDVARGDPDFAVERTTNMFGHEKELIRVRPAVRTPTLEPDDKLICDQVIKTTAPKYWEDFMRLIYSTYPVVTQPRFSTLDLPELAQEYKDSPLFEES